jgi:hypothetical protein
MSVSVNIAPIGSLNSPEVASRVRIVEITSLAPPSEFQYGLNVANDDFSGRLALYTFAWRSFSGLRQRAASWKSQWPRRGSDLTASDRILVCQELTRTLFIRLSEPAHQI